MMPLLFSMGQHPELEAVLAQLIKGEFLFAYLDDICVVNSPKRTGPMYTLLNAGLSVVSQGFASTREKPRSGTGSECNLKARDALERMAHICSDAGHRVLNGEGPRCPRVRQGMQVLGTRVAHMQALSGINCRGHQPICNF